MAHVRAFQAVTTQLYGEVTLASWRINGEMEIVFEGEGSGDGGGGGPRREFKTNKDATRPSNVIS